MSVVAFKGGILAADSRAYGGPGQGSPGRKNKIHRLKDGTRIGITSGILGMPERLVAWLEAGADAEKWGPDPGPDFRAFMVRPNGDVFLAHDSLYFSGPIVCETYAIGSGADAAKGAMLAGCSAEEAVRIACQIDQHCGEPVVVLR